MRKVINLATLVQIDNLKSALRWMMARFDNIAELELSDRTPSERIHALLDWMMHEFLLAGPAALLAAFYFAPRAKKKGMFKRLRSADRESALKGIRNETWDITHLSDFVLKVQSSEDNKKRYLFATVDYKLASVAQLLLSFRDLERLATDLECVLRQWWSQKDAALIAAKFVDSLQAMQTRVKPFFEVSEIDQWIELGEEAIRGAS